MDPSSSSQPRDGDGGSTQGDRTQGGRSQDDSGSTTEPSGGNPRAAPPDAIGGSVTAGINVSLPLPAPYYNPALSTSPFIGAHSSPFFGAPFVHPAFAPQEQLLLPPAPAATPAHAHPQSLLARQLQLRPPQQQALQPPPRKAPRRNTAQDTAADLGAGSLGGGDPAATAALVASLFGAGTAFQAMSPEAMDAAAMEVMRDMTSSERAAALEPAPQAPAAANPPFALPSGTTSSHPSLVSLGAMPHNQTSMSLPMSLSGASAPAVASSLPQNLQPQQGQIRHNATLTSAMNPPHLSPDGVTCVTCGYTGADVRISCAGGGKCAYHARCIDLVTLSANAHQQQGPGGKRQNDGVVITTCPHCNGAAKGLEIIPLSFVELDRAQRQGTEKKTALLGAVSQMAQNAGGGSNDASVETGKKRSSSDMDLGAMGGASYPSNIAQACRATSTTSSQYSSVAGLSSSQCYDPAVPRTGRWTDEELAFRDALIAQFLDGAFPLSNGLKLNDFLSSMLKSKQSRLTKKMKHAKLSTKYFRIKAGHIAPAQKAKEYSTLEHNFINVVADPVERSEIAFHMQKEWRDHLAERCTYLRIRFDAEEWLKSVDAMDRRVALEKNRSRMVKRRCLMGKAMEKDVSESLPGVFINQSDQTDDFLLDQQATSNNPGGSAAGGKEDEDGDFGRFLMSMLDEAPMTANPPTAAPSALPGKKEKGRSSYTDPNFRYAAPFLAGITSYFERHGVPFEHVDVWVPSTVPQALESETAAPKIGSMGSGSSTNLTAMGQGGVTRLCFAGSATLGVQIVDELSSEESKSHDAAKKIVPLTADEGFNFSLFGDYSEKFSFSSGCGLPGRVYASGVAAWEQFLANAPPEMFERRGGAMQFGIKTALGLPIDSRNVGRIVLVLYSMQNREKDDELVQRLVKDMKLFNPCPRWKLVVDVKSTGGTEPAPVLAQPPPAASQPVPPPPGMARSNSSSFNAGMSALSVQPVRQGLAEGSSGNNRQNQTANLVALLQENMPSDASSSPLGNQLHSIMSLRMLLLNANNRTSEEEQFVDTILVLYESYLAAGRRRSDIAQLLTRDYEFHMEHHARTAALSQPLPSGIGGALMAQPNYLLQGQGVGPLVAQGFTPQPQFQPAMQIAAHPFLQQPGLALQPPGMQPISDAMQPMDLSTQQPSLSQPPSSAAAPNNTPSGKAGES